MNYKDITIDEIRQMLTNNGFEQQHCDAVNYGCGVSELNYEDDKIHCYLKEI